MSLPTMKALKWDYFTDPVTNITYYDIVPADPTITQSSSYQTDPLEVIRSKLILRLGTYKGEWADDPDFGIPFDAIKSNNSDPDVVTQLIADEILKVENVTGVQIINKDFNAATRYFTASYNVTTIYGNTTIEVAV